MTDLKDEDIEIGGLFSTPDLFEDNSEFEARVMRHLTLRLWFRHWLVVLAGFIGGLYALAQFLRLPQWVLSGQAIRGESLPGHPLLTAANGTNDSIKAGVHAVDEVRQNLGALTQSSAHYLGMMQTPLFFWVSFTLCLTLIGLYYAYSQEETL